jgi:hypothetical protein
MILYSVQCSHDHVFDEWFSNSADYDAKAAAGEIVCPECGDTKVTKAIMAPNVGKTAQAEAPRCPVGGCAGGGCAFANDF